MRPLTSSTIQTLFGITTTTAAVVLLSLTGPGCAMRLGRSSAESPPDWTQWQAQRRESLVGSNGWTTLVARHWLAQGTTFAGAGITNNLILPTGRAPSCIGQFERRGQVITFIAAPGVIATIDGVAVQKAELRSDASNAPTRLVIGELSFVVIERGDRLGLRVRDPQAPGRIGFKGLDYYPYDPAWRISGRFESWPAIKTMRVQDVLGGTQDLTSPGQLIFVRDGKEYRLDVVEEPTEVDYFLIFRDLTAGKTTYPSGRFLYVARPGPEGGVTIDFNRAYTPPCGFTTFAVCPLPPPQNVLPFAVPAGERRSGH